MLRIIKGGIVCIAVLFAAEMVARFLPVNTGYYLDDVTTQQPVAQRVPNRNATVSEGWLMADAVSRRINNAGFVNATDYVTGSEKPIVALIGDSQIEAPQVQEEETVHYLLQSETDGQIEFYTFAMSGAPLTQYAVWARQAAEFYQPALFVLFISPGDFDESYDRFGLFPGFYYLRDGTDEPAATLREYRRSWGSYLAEYSTLIAYLVHNLELPRAFADPADETLSRLDQEESQRLLTWFFEEAEAAGLDSASTVFVINPFNTSHYDADCGAPIERPAPYDEFQAAATARGYRVLWSQSAFCEMHQETGEQLEGPDGVHWNARGHEAMALYLADALQLDELLNR